ncbi:MAG: FAD-dependent oxidoreductase [Planctomycetes bacterium]|nr:FAD-dependent oxidoreductase [Planctomycetota bacterium]
MRIIVVGAGVSGLSCAIRLLERGHSVVVAGELRTPNVTSDRSAAAFTPFRASGDPRLAGWTKHAFDTFGDIEKRCGREAGVRTTVMSEYYFEPFEGEPWWFAAVGGGKLLKSVPERYAWGLRVRVPTMDMRRYMPWLERRVTALGGRIESARFTDLASVFERGADLVVNTSGLGARELAPDARVTPIRGQIVCAPNNIGLAECLADSGQAGETTYVFPFDDRIVIGGTYEKGVDVIETNETALERIVERARLLLQETGHPRWSELARTRLATWAGLRPARVLGANDVSIRLELEQVAPNRPVVHDYGHAGIGVTVSWGCAQAVAELVDSLG